LRESMLVGRRPRGDVTGIFARRRHIPEILQHISSLVAARTRWRDRRRPSSHMNIAIHDHRRRLLTLARRIGRGHLDPEDLVQDVLERWIRALPRIPPTTHPLAWMIVVLRRLAIDQLRHRRASPEMPAVCSELPAVEPDPTPWWLELEIADVAHALGELSTEL